VLVSPVEFAPDQLVLVGRQFSARIPFFQGPRTSLPLDVPPDVGSRFIQSHRSSPEFRPRFAYALSFFRSRSDAAADLDELSGAGGLSKRLFSLRTTSGVTRNFPLSLLARSGSSNMM